MYLINNAGMAKFCSYGDLSVEESLHMVDLNISGVVAMGLVCLPFMGKGSHVVNIASQAASEPLPDFSAIAVPEYIQFNKSLCPQLYESFKCGIKGNGNPGYGSLSGVDEHRTD